jgi:hypothetical protein
VTNVKAGRPAIYYFNGTETPVTLMQLNADGEAIIAFSDGRLEVVPLSRVRLVTP